MKTYAARDLLRVPGLLSLARLPLGIAFAATTAHPDWQIGLLVAAAVTDMLDGWYARRFGEETKTGAVLDPVMDKCFVLTVLVTMIASSRLSWFEALLLATRDIGELPLIVGVAASGRRERTARRSPNVAGKLTTTLQFLTIAALLLETTHRSLFILSTCICGAFAALSYSVRELRARRTGRF